MNNKKPYVKRLRLRFYADKPGEYTNKLFTFNVLNEELAQKLLINFISNGNKIRSAFLQEFQYTFLGHIEVIEDLQIEQEILKQYHLLYA